jgi:hypothetical protein
MTYCDRGYDRPPGRPRVSDPATYCSSTPRVQPPAVGRWHSLLHGLPTAIHETSGLDISFNIENLVTTPTIDIPLFLKPICGYIVNPNVANLHRPKALDSRQSTPYASVLASARTSRAVKYASTCPRLREATSDAPWRVFPRCRFATLGLM